MLDNGVKTSRAEGFAMSNDCTFSMFVAGRKESVQKAYRRLSYEDDTSPHFARIKDLEQPGEPWAQSDDGEVVLMAFYGCCAWSVESCMRGVYEIAYYHANPDELTTLELTARELDVDIEVYSCEPGMGFAEHYRYEGSSGRCIEDETVDYRELYFVDQEDFEENREAYGVPEGITYEDLDDGNYRDGGFDESCSVSVEGWVSRHGILPTRKA